MEEAKVAGGREGRRGDRKRGRNKSPANKVTQFDYSGEDDYSGWQT